MPYSRFAFRGSGCRGTRRASKIALSADSGKTVRGRNQGRSSFDAAAAGSDLSRRQFSATSFVADKRSRAKGFDVHSSAPADRGRNEKPIELKDGQTLHVDFP